MSAVLTAFWNRHKKFKQNQKNGKPSHCVIICDLVSSKNNKLGIRQIFQKSVLRNEVSCMKIQSFRARRPMLWRNSRHRFSRWSHILHKRAAWNSKQCHAEGSFDFLCIKKSFSIFWVRKMVCFVKNLSNIYCQIAPLYFSKILDHILCPIDQIVVCQKFFIYISSNRQISADSVGSGSNLNYSCFIVCLLLFLKKIIFRYTSSLFYQRSNKSFARFNPLATNGYARRFDCILKSA